MSLSADCEQRSCDHSEVFCIEAKFRLFPSGLTRAQDVDSDRMVTSEHSRRNNEYLCNACSALEFRILLDEWPGGGDIVFHLKPSLPEINAKYSDTFNTGQRCFPKCVFCRSVNKQLNLYSRAIGKGNRLLLCETNTGTLKLSSFLEDHLDKFSQ